MLAEISVNGTYNFTNLGAYRLEMKSPGQIIGD